MGSAFQGVGKIVSTGLIAAGVAGVAGLAIVLHAGLKEWVESTKVAAQTEAVIKSTGASANVTAKEVDALAQSIMNKSGIDDEAIKTGENMLLTFTNIRNEAGAGNDIFNQATQAITDMDVAMTHGNTTQESLAHTAILVGKALNDPIKGATALRRVGVSLTEAQQEQIKAFVKSGDTMKAQKIIVAELTKEFGGSAKAMGDTLPGKINILRQNFQNLAGTIVGSLAPAFSGAIAGLTGFIKDLNAAHGFKAKISVVFDVAKDAFNAVRAQIQRLLFGGTTVMKWGGGAAVTIDKGMVEKIRDAFAKLDWTAVGKSVIDGIIGALKTAGRLALELANTVSDAIGKVDWVKVGKVIGPGLAAALVTAFVTLLDPGFWARNWELALSVALVAFGGVFGKLGGRLVAMFSRPFADATLAVAGMLERISPKLGEAILSGLMRLPTLLGDFFKQEEKKLEEVVTGMFGRLAGLATFTIKVLGIEIAIHAITQFATGPVWNTIQTAFTTVQTVATTTWNAITAGVRTFATTITSAMTLAWSSVQTATTTALTSITGAVTTAFTTMQNGVTVGMAAIGNAMTTAWGAIKTAAVTAWNFLIGTITGAISRAAGEAKKVGAGILSGITGALTGLAGAVKGKLDALWGLISRVAGLALNAAKAIGAQIIHGIISGLGDIAKSIGSKLKDGVEAGLHAIDPRRLRPWSPISHWAVLLAQEMTKEMGSVTSILGSSLTKALTAALRGATTAAGPEAVKGMNNVGQMIVAAAKKYGVDAKAALAVAMGEGGIKFGAVGDSGHAFGPFQFNNKSGIASGMSAANASAWANSAKGISDAIRMMADAGAKGKVGLDAITAIVSEFERPRNIPASIAKAAEAYKTLGPQVAAAVASGTPAVSAAHQAQINAIAALVTHFAPIIGLEHARAVVAGLVQGQPTMLQQAREGMLAVVAAQKQALADAKAGLTTAFSTLISGALSGVDAAFANWKPPSQILLEKLQLADQIKSLTDTLGPAVTDAETKLAAAFKTGNAAAIAQAQTDLNAALATANSTIAANAATAVTAAQTALAAAQATGDQGKIDTAQAALDKALADQKTILDTAGKDQNAVIEFNLTQRAEMETRQHNTRLGNLKRDMGADLLEIQKNLKNGTISWETAQKEITKVIDKYKPIIKKEGGNLATEFAKGILSGIGDVRKAAQDLVNAANAITGGSAPSNVVTNVIKGIALPFAGGGVVDKPTLALIGEKGREAVIPLPRGMAPPSQAELAMLAELRRQTAALETDKGTKLSLVDWRGQPISPNEIALEATR